MLLATDARLCSRARRHDRKFSIDVLAEPWADTATSTGRVMIAVLCGQADVERDLIRTSAAEGGSRAKVRGQHMGRPPKLTPQQQARSGRVANDWQFAVMAAMR